MAWNLDSDRPIYTQIVEKIQMQIVSGYYKPGDKLPSVRELAAIANVTPNTLQRAFADLERGGLIVTERTNGRFVTEDKEMIRDIQESLAEEQIRTFFVKMQELGFSQNDTVELIQRVSKEGN